MLLSAAIALVQVIGLLIGPGAYNFGAPFGLLLPLMFVEWLVTNGALQILYREVDA